MKKEAFKFGLAGALIIFVASTILHAAGFSASLGQDEEILFSLQVASSLAAIASAVGLLLT
jgi:tetrahydromethanopterin S-methyltransferase subunit C